MAETERPTLAGGVMFDQLILAIDGSPATPVATDFAAALATSGARVHVLLVNERLVNGLGEALLSRDEAVRVVDEAIETLRAAGLRASGSVHFASYREVPDRIVAVALERHADAIVVGSRRRRGILARMFSGRVREQVVRRTPLPVIVAPSPLEVGRRLSVGPDGAGDASRSSARVRSAPPSA